jgi:chromosome segregation ATPase
MKPLLNIIAITAAGAGIFFSFSLSNKFKEQQNERLAAIEQNKKVTATKDATDASLTKEKAALAEASNEHASAEQAVNSLKSAGATLKRDYDAQQAVLESQKREFDELNKTIEALKSAVAELGADVTLETLPDKVKELKNKQDELEAKSTELAALVEAGSKRRDGQKDETVRLADVKSKRDARISLNATESVLTAVNQEWGFVVIGAGQNTGFTPQTKLLIQRDGRLIGKVHPISVEANQTLGDIDFDSLAPGVRLQVGDRVILAEPATN